MRIIIAYNSILQGRIKNLRVILDSNLSENELITKKSRYDYELNIGHLSNKN